MAQPFGLNIARPPGPGATSAITKIGGPLAVVALIVWILYMVRDRGQVPGHVHAWMFLPPLAALLIVPIAMTIEQNKFDRLAEAHPTIYETHINFTGHDLWLDTRPYASTSSGGGPDRPFSARRPERFSRFSRWPNGAQSEAERASFPYEGSRLKDGVNQYTYLSATNEAASSVPLRLLPYRGNPPGKAVESEVEFSH